MKPASMQLLLHHLYEYRKGVRQMFMMTLPSHEAEAITNRLAAESIEFHLHRVNQAKVNVLFGRAAWVETARRVVTKPLSRLSPEEDFILGTLLGYDREQQCQRFLAMANGPRGMQGAKASA